MPQAQVQSRNILWVSIVRGLGAMAVVLTHVFQRLTLEGQIDPTGGQGSSFGDLVRMQSMVFVAGFFVIPSLAKGTAAFATAKASTVLWPFIVWSPIYYYIWMEIGLLPPVTDLPATAIKLAFKPILHLWFLQHLLIFFALAWLLYRRGQPSVKCLVATTILIAAPPLLLGSLPTDTLLLLLPEQMDAYVNDIHNVSDRALRFGTLMVFFSLGIAARMVGAELIEAIVAPRALPVAGGAMLLTLLGALALALPKYSPQALPVSMIGILGFIAFAMVLQRFERPRNIVIRIGNYSLEIYILHLAVILLLQRTLVPLIDEWPDALIVAKVALLTMTICIASAVVTRYSVGNIPFTLRKQAGSAA